MNKTHCIPLIVTSFFLFICWKNIDTNWISEKQRGYILCFTAADKNNKPEYKKFIDNGMTFVKKFFHSGYSKTFTVFIHPNRHSLDSTWQKDWNMPNFKSDCWMVASGVATRLNIISPKCWDKEACEHIYAETKNTQQLITHELVHIFHGQLNASPDFSNTKGIDWFVEGLATFASGQCDTSRIAAVKKAIADNKIPKRLDDFWTGNIKYGLSGSVVMYIDQTYGRAKLKALLPLNKKVEILSALKITEAELITGWRKYVENL